MAKKALPNGDRFADRGEGIIVRDELGRVIKGVNEHANPDLSPKPTKPLPTGRAPGQPSRPAR